MEAEYDLYAADGKRCLLSCNDSGQQRPFISSLGGAQLFETDSSFLAMDGAAAGSGGARFSPYSHDRHDAEKHKLGASLWASCDHNAAAAAGIASQHLQPVELLERRFASSAAGGPGPSSGSVEHCYMLHVVDDYPWWHRPAAVVLVATY